MFRVDNQTAWVFVLGTPAGLERWVGEGVFRAALPPQMHSGPRT